MEKTLKKIRESFHLVRGGDYLGVYKKGSEKPPFRGVEIYGDYEGDPYATVSISMGIDEDSGEGPLVDAVAKLKAEIESQVASDIQNLTVLEEFGKLVLPQATWEICNYPSDGDSNYEVTFPKSLNQKAIEILEALWLSATPIRDRNFLPSLFKPAEDDNTTDSN